MKVESFCSGGGGGSHLGYFHHWDWRACAWIGHGAQCRGGHFKYKCSQSKLAKSCSRNDLVSKFVLLNIQHRKETAHGEKAARATGSLPSCPQGWPELQQGIPAHPSPVLTFCRCSLVLLFIVTHFERKWGQLWLASFCMLLNGSRFFFLSGEEKKLFVSHRTPEVLLGCSYFAE